MAAFGKVLDLLDDRYLELQDVVGNVEPLPTLVPYDEYIQNVLVYRMDTNHEIFMGLIQDFTMRRAHETGKELWTWFVQWEVDNSAPTNQVLSPKKARLDARQAVLPSNAPPISRQAPALTIFERRTLDGALMLEEDMLRILIDIVQVASALVPNFIEFLYRWIDYYEGDGKALKAALKWEIPSLWDFEYHPLVLPSDLRKEGDTEEADDIQSNGQRETEVGSVSNSKAAELRQSSPTKKMHARPKPDVAAIELCTFYTEESERLQYREVRFGIQPPKLEQPLPPLINIPRDGRKRTKYYAACFKSRQRALYLLLEAGVTMRQINNYQKLQSAHPRETPEAGDDNGLRNYHKDAKYAQAQFELKEKQIKQHEIAISNKLAVEARLADSHAVPDGAAGLPLIPPTPSFARKPDMAAAMMQRLKETRAKKDHRIKIVPKPLVGRMKSKVFENARSESPLISIRDYMTEAKRHISRSLLAPEGNSSGSADTDEHLTVIRVGESQGEEEDEEDEGTETDTDYSASSDYHDSGTETLVTAAPTSTPALPRPLLPLALPPSSTFTSNTATNHANDTVLDADEQDAVQSGINVAASGSQNRSVLPNIAAYMQNLNTEQAQDLLALLSPEAQQAATSKLQESSQSTDFALDETSMEVAAAVSSRANGPESAEDGLQQTVPGIPLPLPSLMPPPADTQRLESPVNATFGPLNRPSLLPPFAVGSSAAAEQQDAWLARPAFTEFDVEHFLRLCHQQEASDATTNDTAHTAQPTSPFTLAEQWQATAASEYGEQSPAQRQRMLSADFPAINGRAGVVQPAKTNTQPPQQSQTIRPTDLVQGDWRPSGQHSTYQEPVKPSAVLAQPLPRPLPLPQLHPHPHSLPPSSVTQTSHPAPSMPSTPQPPYHTPSNPMLPPPRPGISRNAPTPLSLPIPQPSPFTTLAPQILATSPFLPPSSATTPIQIYLPGILIPGNGLGPSGTPMGNNGVVETDALLLGYETSPGKGDITLSKAILLPVGVWDNTLRKVRTGRWSVVETYACPSSHPAKSKGKGRAGETQREGCHRAVYEKLETVFGFMARDAGRREALLTKRWRVSRGLMTGLERGAVWEGWGVCVDKGVGMCVGEREGAVRGFADGTDGGGGACSDAEETVRRRREMQELMDEDEDMMDD